MSSYIQGTGRKPKTFVIFVWKTRARMNLRAIRIADTSRIEKK